MLYITIILIYFNYISHYFYNYFNDDFPYIDYDLNYLIEIK